MTARPIPDQRRGVSNAESMELVVAKLWKQMNAKPNVTSSSNE